jgi:hypothetical protein
MDQPAGIRMIVQNGLAQTDGIPDAPFKKVPVNIFIFARQDSDRDLGAQIDVAFTHQMAGIADHRDDVTGLAFSIHPRNFGPIHPRMTGLNAVISPFFQVYTYH